MGKQVWEEFDIYDRIPIIIDYTYLSTHTGLNYIVKHLFGQWENRKKQRESSKYRCVKPCLTGYISWVLPTDSWQGNHN